MQERFAVRTSWYDKAVLHHKTTIAVGRPEAVIHAERIGEIDKADKPVIRSFLEGRGMVNDHLCVTSGGESWAGVATIYLIND